MKNGKILAVLLATVFFVSMFNAGTNAVNERLVSKSKSTINAYDARIQAIENAASGIDATEGQRSKK